MAEIIHKLHQGELRQQENLIALLSAIKGSKITGPESRLPSILRGLRTANQKLIQVAGKCLADLNGTGEDMELFKMFITEYIMWFDANFVVFEKFLLCISAEHISEGPLYQNPVLHCRNYVQLAVSAAAVLRNPFIIEKLDDFKARAGTLIENMTQITLQARLNDISFDHVQTVGGRKVSCFFTPEQIVKRTADVPLYMGKSMVEMLLLNLGQKDLQKFDSLAILNVPAIPAKRSVVYPPFRVNELSISVSQNCINFMSSSLDQKQVIFSVSGKESVVSQWFHDLKKIFPTDEKLLQSATVQLHGLGIETVLDSSDHESQPLPCTSQELNALKGRRSLDSCHSFEIMKKTFSNSGIAAEDKEKQLKVVEAEKQHHSITAEYAYPDELEAELSSVDSIECFDMVTTKPAKVLAKETAPAGNDNKKTATEPNLTSIYVNAAGSAIDVNNFGKHHNPSFVSLPAEQKKVTKKKSFLDLFRKKKEDKAKDSDAKEGGGYRSQKSQESTAVVTKKVQPEESDKTPPAKVAILDPKQPKTAGKRHPDLQIEIPKISAFDANNSQPGSAVSTSNRTLPLPFALPSSTSTYFFKPYLNGGSTSDLNDSTVSLGALEEKSYEIPQDFKDIVNAEDTLDFYITPTAANSIKVSKWKHHCGKWELLTANENVFMKIVANYNLYKSWLLVFKEEYDEEYGEIIDKPLLVLDLDENTSTRNSTALDVEVHAVDSFSKLKTHIIVRCYNRTLVQAISTNLSNILEVMESKKGLKQSNTFESSATLSSSLMSKPSTSSTLTSIFTHIEQKQTPVSSVCKTFESTPEVVAGAKLLLDRMTIKLHKQIDVNEDNEDVYLWVFKDDEIHDQIERIGKAAMLVKTKGPETYMLECRGKKEFKRLVNLF
ncbi:hypothetical protein HF325_003244 [Metschnikowia pulcherrima]|uniref:PH-like domain-containing protein n=1 Tax=Metschnikowia pulcherrima TaxID=27326 RepID=A0A8H7LBH4_9ASCO|nr:hypothetical protein HF325_003244 [Metschnikowia pulcherrima]